MLDFIETGRALQVIYQYVKAEILEHDFFILPEESYEKLPESDWGKTWYTLNPDKLNAQYFKESAVFIVDEREKMVILRAIAFINHASSELSDTASFLEKLLYTKKCIPSCFFSSHKKADGDEAKVISLIK